MYSYAAYWLIGILKLNEIFDMIYHDDKNYEVYFDQRGFLSVIIRALHTIKYLILVYNFEILDTKPSLANTVYISRQTNDSMFQYSIWYVVRYFNGINPSDL